MVQDGPYSIWCKMVLIPRIYFLCFGTHAIQLQMAWTSTIPGRGAKGHIFWTCGAWTHVQKGCTNLVYTTSHAWSGSYAKKTSMVTLTHTEQSTMPKAKHTKNDTKLSFPVFSDPLCADIPSQFIDNQVPRQAICIYGFAHWWCESKDKPYPDS